MVNHHRNHVEKDDNYDEDFKPGVRREIKEPHPYLVLFRNNNKYCKLIRVYILLSKRSLSNLSKTLNFVVVVVFICVWFVLIKKIHSSNRDEGVNFKEFVIRYNGRCYTNL